MAAFKQQPSQRLQESRCSTAADEAMIDAAVAGHVDLVRVLY